MKKARGPKAAVKKAVQEGSGQQGRDQAGSGQEGSGQEGHSPSRPSLDANRIKRRFAADPALEPLRGEFACQVTTLAASALPM